MEELLGMAIGGIGMLLATALGGAIAEGLGEALGELFGAVAEGLGELFGGLFGAIAEAGGAVVGAIAGAGGEAVAEAGSEAVGTIGESGNEAGVVALGAIAAENGDTGGEPGGTSGSGMHFYPSSGRHASGIGRGQQNEDKKWVMPEDTAMTTGDYSGGDTGATDDSTASDSAPGSSAAGKLREQDSFWRPLPSPDIRQDGMMTPVEQDQFWPRV